jgi:hypothetical protein
MMKRLLTALLLLLSFTAMAQDDEDDNDRKPVRAERMKQQPKQGNEDDDNTAANPLKHQLMQQATVIKVQLADRNRAAAENAFRKSMQLLERYEKQLDNKIKNTEKQDEKALYTDMINSLKEDREELKQLSYEMIENGEEIIGKFNSIAEDM